jgi:8-oxo-dGTP pyrophosphatase MutT (NUDIX family)
MSPSFDPLALPDLGVDDHLPPVALGHLSPAALRQRFVERPVWVPELKVERPYVERAPALASVLVPLVERREVSVLLTQRTEHLKHHPGQIAFPGGRSERGDADVVATALREAREEIGLEAAQVEVLGAMPTYATGTGFVVTPVVALLPPDVRVRADPSEVAEVFEVPLAFLMDPAHHHRHAVEVAGIERQFLSIPWQGVDAQGRPRSYFIWGATAAMLRNLYRFLAA